MNSFYNRNIFSRKKFHKETQVDFNFNDIEICLLKNKIKQLELSLKTKPRYEFGVDEENNKRYVRCVGKYIMFY